MEKQPFELPDFIKDTGVPQMRASMRQADDNKSFQAKQREKIRPKMGKLSMDYQRLHDAFFVYQKKPPMTLAGELYYEGRECEARARHKRPGDLSEGLKECLGMPDGAPPPWLINMQRYGPPAAYPGLRIPGLNAPIPSGAHWGYNPGEWGKVPTDEYNRPVYGGAFSSERRPVGPGGVQLEPHWGVLEPDPEEEEEEEEAVVPDEALEPDSTTPVKVNEHLASDAYAAGLATPSGLLSVASSVPSGLDTPDHIELRKDSVKRYCSPTSYSICSSSHSHNHPSGRSQSRCIKCCPLRRAKPAFLDPVTRMKCHQRMVSHAPPLNERWMTLSRWPSTPPRWSK